MAPNNSIPNTLSLLGVPIEVGASQKGALMGPAALRTAGLVSLLESLGYAVEDRGDLALGGSADRSDNER